MKTTLLALALAGCVATIPPPQPARTECNAAVTSAGPSTYGNSTCYHVPADHCYGNGSEYCQQREREREAHNSRAARNGVLWLVALGAVSTVLIVLAVNAEQ